MRDITVILPIHEFNSEIGNWLKMSVNSVNIQIEKPEKFIIVYNPAIEKEIKETITDQETNNIKDIINVIEKIPNFQIRNDYYGEIQCILLLLLNLTGR